MKHKKLTVCQSNKVVEAGYKLTLNELRVVLACIGQVNSVNELFETDEFELSAKDFALLFDLSENNAYHALIEVTDTLFNRYVVIDNPYPDRPRVTRLKMRWISSIEYLSDEGKIVLCFSKKILPYLGKLRSEFTQYKLEHIGKMTSIYAIRLYQLLAQWKGTGKREVDIAWLKKQFQIEEGYERMFDFKKYVIDPAVKDINQHSNFTVSWTQRKTGRNVSHLTFSFAEKPPEKKIIKSAASTNPSSELAPLGTLIYPSSISALEQEKCAALLAGIAPETAQELLDTLEAAIRAGQVKKSKLALLVGIIKRFNSGTFDPSSAMQIAIERQLKAANELANKKAYLNGEIAVLERLYNHSKDSHILSQLECAKEQLAALQAATPLS